MSASIIRLFFLSMVLVLRSLSEEINFKIRNVIQPGIDGSLLELEIWRQDGNQIKSFKKYEAENSSSWDMDPRRLEDHESIKAAEQAFKQVDYNPFIHGPFNEREAEYVAVPSEAANPKAVYINLTKECSNFIMIKNCSNPKHGHEQNVLQKSKPLIFSSFAIFKSNAKHQEFSKND